MLLRIPEWTSVQDMAVTIDGRAQPVAADATMAGFARLNIEGECVVQLSFKMEIRAEVGRTVWNGWQSSDDKGGQGQPSHSTEQPQQPRSRAAAEAAPWRAAPRGGTGSGG